MGFEDQDDDNAGGNQGTIGLVITLSVILSLVVVILILLIIRFCAKSSQQRTRHNDLLYHVRIRIAPTNDTNSSDQSPPNSGLDPEIIAALPKVLYKETDQFKKGEVIMECSVCLGTITEDAEIRVIPNCNHMFHVDCVDTWLSSNRTCPVCRTVAEPRVELGNSDHLAKEDGVGVSRDHVNHELEKVEMGCSGLRTASFPRMVISMGRRSLRRNTSYDGSAAVIEDVEYQ